MDEVIRYYRQLPRSGYRIDVRWEVWVDGKVFDSRLAAAKYVFDEVGEHTFREGAWYVRHLPVKEVDVGW